jgi:Uma2 family endonuclease
MAMVLAVPRYTVDDLENFPDDGNRYELLDGMLLVTPAPAASHQLVATRLSTRLDMAVGLTGHAHVVAPGAVVRPPRTQLQPDVLVFPAHYNPNLDWRKFGEHWLAIEVLSRSSRIYDREFKRDAYFALGVKEVWLVDRRDKSVEVCSARGPGEVVRDTIRWRVPTLDLIVSISLDEIFAGLE